MSFPQWLEARTGARLAMRRFFSEKIPRSAGWPQVFGSAAMFVLLVQAVTGVLLSLNFAAAPGDAYDSISYLMREVTGGRIIRGLHHWGASMMIVVVAAHAIQVFVFGAYKRPREATWLAGVALLLGVLAFSLTGYLLPWDNRAYWGTVVTTQIAGQAPIAGKWVQQFLGASSGVGAVTFTRFYALHVVVLPAITLLLIVTHLYLVRRHGVAPSASDQGSTVDFYPGQVAKDTLAIFVVFALLMAAAVFLRIPIERAADPSDTSYVPRPEWYFLSLFQLLKYFHGPLEPFVSVGLPTIALLTLVLVPFLDRSTEGFLRRRWWAVMVSAAFVASWSGLTYLALQGTPAKSSIATNGTSDLKLLSFPPDELAGFSFFRQGDCRSCHNLTDGDPKEGPTLALLTDRRPPPWIESHIRSLSDNRTRDLGPAEVTALVQFVTKLDPEKASRLESAPAMLLEGAAIYTRNLCQSCHRVNGAGGQIGPSLNGVAGRRSRSWVQRHFVQPRVMSPGTLMPPYHFSPDDGSKLVDYLFALP